GEWGWGPTSTKNDILERHVDDGHGDERFDERWEPEGGWSDAIGCGDERDRMRDGERGHDHDERSDAPERDDQAHQEQQVIGAIENVQDPERHKAQPRLTPAWIEPDEPGIAGELERPLGTGRRQKAH